MLVKLDHETPGIRDENSKNIWVATNQNYPVIWKIPRLFSSPISGEIDHP